MKNLIIILVVVVLVVILYNVFKKKSNNKPPVADDKSNQITGVSQTNTTNYAGLEIPNTATPPISSNTGNYVYIQKKYSTSIKVYTSPGLTSFVTLPAGSFVGELKETKVIGGYEFYVTTSGRYVQKIFSELKGVK